MPHVLDLPVQLQREFLYNMSIGEIKPIVKFIGRMKEVLSNTAGGAPVFGGYTEIELDISDRVQDRISLNIEKPRIPNDDSTGLIVSEVTINLVNTDEYFSAVQDNAIIDLQDIENAEIRIFAQLEGVTQIVPIYRGRVIAPPVESFGVTTFTIRDIGYDIINKPVLFEQLNSLPLPLPAYISSVSGTQSVSAGQIDLLSDSKRIQTTAGGKINFHSGLVTFDGLGEAIVRVNNNNPETIKLRNLTIKNGAKPGNYKIEFEGKYRFKLTYPDNSTFNGDILSDFSSPLVDIPRIGWIIEQVEIEVSTPLSVTYDIDASGTQIDFQVFYSVSGNPGTICKNILEKGLSDNIGGYPSSGSTTMPYTQIRVDWPAFDEMERRFADICLHVSETNDDNKVWEQKFDSMPLSWYQLAQKVADHVCCYIVLQPDGLLTVKLPFMDDTDIWDHSTEEAITEINIEPVEQYNYIRVQYGYDNNSKAYLVSEEADLRSNADLTASILTINAPYFKAGRSIRQAQWLRDTIIRHYLSKQVNINISVLPQFGLPLLPGDKFKLISRVQPKLSQYVEVRSISKQIGGICSLECTPIDSPEGSQFALCQASFSDELLY